MRYFGGKARIANKIIPIISSARQGLYVEPFVGGCNTFCKMEDPKLGLDVVPELIELWEALQGGWKPPKTVTKEMYQAAKDGLITGADRAFIGFGCSFGGKWFGGYARSANRNYAENAYNSLMKKLPGIKEASFRVQDYFTFDISDATIYCDPPYAGHVQPGTRSNFDHDMFWEHTKHLATKNIVFVSEVTAPVGEVVWEQTVAIDMQTNNRTRTEKLYKL